MKGYHSCDGPAELVTVGQVLDGMPFGFFHMTHIAWALAAIAVLAIQYEMTPYMFPGLQLHFGADREELSTFAAAFQAGCAFGTMMAPALADRMGRKPTLIFSITLCATLSYASALSKSLHMLMVLRTLSSASWAIGWNALSPWYVEFLPTKTRGAMLTALSLGWPIGRGTVILWSQLLGSDWQQLMKLQAIAMMVLMAGTSLINESPMYLAYRGRLQEARRVLDAVHRSNGSQWRSDCQLCLDDTGTNTVDERTWQELLSPEYRSRTAFCWILFALLSGTTILIDTWGPIIFQHLIFPGHTELPRGLLMLFNIGDLIGLVVSVFVIDRIGRKGGFVIGFFLQGIILITLSGATTFGGARVCLQAIMGMTATGCRGFAWEGATMWALEAFPTSLRAAALCSSRVCMQVMAVFTLKVSAEYLAFYSASQWLQIFGVLLIMAGGVVVVLNPRETAGVPLAEGSDRDATIPAAAA
ncbi:unnamed protein product [Effrenium voratum]|nr:unnamed protein product [Effrenium voratum]|mmetsp:Transcript_7061/g.16882  ORF Transcript_7061/g.16882 Transcript_7061/m.16882 type:complete len:472 (-) Transcript_7061:106-1521(-)|eukprot:CAMPEP_0181454172 /NCGR_PEP_ID=MMETSP1110-20121109/30099_1 /TAXON_ID=174948 /ORGANISM="Symbiodinium sp., Strain CCMP421" /LENGTH=471 /DNA_ID=CAMNT_0023578505 /DNA_START=51 /DNA_END=1466 /DNA_ORIENTATION=+